MGLIDYAEGQASNAAQEGQTYVSNTIQSVQNWVNGVSSSYVLIPPKGSKGGIAGFVFDYDGESQLSLKSDITNHFAENNSSVQDHIALFPYAVTLRGFVSELTMPATSGGFFGALSTLQSNIATVSAYLGKYTPQALQNLQGSASKAISQVQSYAATAAGYLNQAQNIATFLGIPGAAPTKQQQAFITLATLRDQRTIFTVLTPWVFLSGMAIENLDFIQSKDSKTRSDIIVTMKQMRFVDIQSYQNVSGNAAGRAMSMYQPQTTLGSTAGTPTSFQTATGAFAAPVA